MITFVKRLLEWSKRNRRRLPTRWLDDIIKITKNWIRNAQDRKEWTKLGEAYVQQ